MWTRRLWHLPLVESVTAQRFLVRLACVRGKLVLCRDAWLACYFKNALWRKAPAFPREGHHHHLRHFGRWMEESMLPFRYGGEENLDAWCNRLEGRDGCGRYLANHLDVAHFRDKHPIASRPGRTSSSDDDRGDLHDDKRVQTFADASSHQFGAKNEPAMSTLPTSFGGTISQMRSIR